jgi:uncharacterized membrane protein YedE/YeeE
MSDRVNSAAAPTRLSVDGLVVGAAVLLMALLAWQAGVTAGARQAALVVVGGLMGLTLYHASFGFTAAWRRFTSTGDGQGLRAQMLMLGIAVCLFFPALAAGEILGTRIWGFVFPVGTSVVVGAFIFGIGMQLGGGCGSGTLFTVGGGSTRMLLTLFFFVVGSVVAIGHLPFWAGLPSLGGVSAITTLGLWPALALHLALFAGIVALTVHVERRRGVARSPARLADWLRGPWPIVAGAVALALLNFATLWLAGRPWGITSAFALWGGKGLDAAGVDLAAWTNWGGMVGALERSILFDVTSVMNFGIILGAMLAAGLAGKFKPALRLSRGDLASAVIGGLLLGYGARLAFGCNIGAFFSGIASGSLHGWVWLAAAFLGSMVGVRLRPLFGLSRG